MVPFEFLSALVGVQPSSSNAKSSKDTSTSHSLWVPFGARGVFGGQVIAQALASSSLTINPPLSLHSFHCYFLLPAHASPQIEYRVERLRDGKTYSNRLVRAWQGDREVFVLLASYTLPPLSMSLLAFDASDSDPAGTEEREKTIGSSEDDTTSKVSHSLRFALPQTGDEEGERSSTPVPRGARYDPRQSISTSTSKPKSLKIGFQPKFQVAFPTDLLPYEECEEEEERWSKFLENKGSSWSGRRRRFLEEYIRERKGSPVGISRALTRGYDEALHDDAQMASQQTRLVWLRARLGPHENPDIETVKAMIAYMTDFQFIGTASRSVGLHQASTPRLGMLASLDHSIHFYPFPNDFKPSEPLLHVMEAQSVDVASGRGVVQGRVYTKDGILIAVTAQEGVVRADLKGLKAKGLVEGGAVEDEEKEDKKKNVEGRSRAKL